MGGEESGELNGEDIGGVDDNLLKMLEIGMIEGCLFREGNDRWREMMIEEKMVGKLEKVFDWKDGVMGKGIEYWGDGKV